MKKLRSIPLTTSILLAAVSSVSRDASAQNADGALRLPHVQSSRGGSLNWSGYAVSAPQVTSVTATFNVPVVDPPGGTAKLPPDVSAWVGIDGYTSGTVEQIGVSGSWDAASGKPVYYAWWEMYPRNSETIKGMTISPGDEITASVQYAGGGTFILSIRDNDNGQSFTKTASAPVGGRDAAQLNSAEWVVERAATIYKGYLTILPLTTFESPPGIEFNQATFTVAGQTDPITLQTVVDDPTREYSGDPSITPPPQPYWEHMTMVDLDSGGNPFALDEVSAVTGNSFTATFLKNGSPLPLPGVIRKK